MRTRSLGKSGFEVSELSLGTWGLSGDAYGPVDEKEAERTVLRAVDLGITLFDTADAYGGGRMEALLGRCLYKKEPCRIVTKVGIDRTTDPARRNFSPEYLRGAVLRSKKRLQRERIDLVLLHNPGVHTLTDGAAAATLTSLVQEGIIGAWGAAVSDEATARAALEHGAEVLSLAHNLFFSGELSRLAPLLLSQRAGVLAHSVLAYGLLSGLWIKGHTFGAGDHRAGRWSMFEFDQRIDHLAAVRPLVTGDVHSVRAAALRFVLCNPLVGSAVLGPMNEGELLGLVRDAGSGPPYLPDKALSELPARLMAAGVTS